VSNAHSDRPREACGLFAVFDHPEAVELTYHGLYGLQHRGQESAGIACHMGGRIKSYVGMGLVGEVFKEEFFAKFRSNVAIGHTRYSTAGSSNVRNAQPITVDYSGGQISVAHNGNLSNGWQLRRDLEAQGSIFQTTSDSEVVLHLLARPEVKNSSSPIAAALKHLRGAFSFVFLTNDSILATRDPNGFRPLCIGKLGDSFVLASESCAFDMLGVEYLREVEPGELVRIDDKGLHSSRWCEVERKSHCIFEHVYFSRPDTRRMILNSTPSTSHWLAQVDVPVPSQALRGTAPSSWARGAAVSR
jgi:amidophosphoribosyltransferase